MSDELGELRNFVEAKISEYNEQLDKAENQDQRNFYQGCLFAIYPIYAKILYMQTLS